MRKAILLLALLSLAGCGVKPSFPKAPQDSTPPRTYPNPASDPSRPNPANEKPQ